MTVRQLKEFLAAMPDHYEVEFIDRDGVIFWPETNNLGELNKDIFVIDMTKGD